LFGLIWSLTQECERGFSPMMARSASSLTGMQTSLKMYVRPH
jgi:hypothetical protein